MTKVLFLLSAVVMAVACFFSWQNRTTFVETRKARQDIDRTIGVEYTKANNAANDVVAKKGEVASMNGELEQEKTRKDQAELKLRNTNSEHDRYEADLTSTNKEIADLRSQIDSSLPPGATLENLGESINKQKTQIAENEEKARKLQEAVAGKEKELKKANDDLSDVQKRLDDRRRMFDRNSLVATVVAVNNDWGFVVIDAGKNKEITPDTKLIVTRGNETIGKLSIVSVEGTKTVANIVQKSLRSGIAVTPGDRVILENLYQ